MEAIDWVKRLFRSAPRELRSIIDCGMSALAKKNFDEALNCLSEAHGLINRCRLDEWVAEVAAAWAVYYHRQGERAAMRQAIQYALQREPDNKRIFELKEVLTSSRSNPTARPQHKIP